jgi:predicted RNA-binding Zn ribbon-like protein
MPRTRPAAPLVANVAWLDFVNTRYRGTRGWLDAIPSPRALGDWLIAAGLAPLPGGPRAIAALRGKSGGGRLLRDAHAFRTLLAELAHRLTGGLPPKPTAVDAINRVLRAAPEYDQLHRDGHRFLTRRLPSQADPLALLAPIARSAAVFLERGDIGRLRACGNPTCVLYFYDRTRNGRRRFCSALTCGNRVKARRRYHRLRAQQPG